MTSEEAGPRRGREQSTNQRAGLNRGARGLISKYTYIYMNTFYYCADRTSIEYVTVRDFVEREMLYKDTHLYLYTLHVAKLLNISSLVLQGHTGSARSVIILIGLSGRSYCQQIATQETL